MTKPKKQYEFKTSWTDQRIERLKELVGRNWTARQIAEDLGCTKNSVLGKTFRLGISTASETEEQAAERKRRTAEQKARNGRGGTVKRKLKPRLDGKRTRPKIIEVAPEVVGLGIGLMDLTAVTCRWPTNDDMTNARFCGHDISAGSPYCPHHRFRSSGRSEIVCEEAELGPAINGPLALSRLKVA